jgi:hypothetical protein
MERKKKRKRRRCTLDSDEKLRRTLEGTRERCRVKCRNERGKRGNGPEKKRNLSREKRKSQ